MAASTKTSSLVDTRVIYCGDNLEQLRKLPAACVDPIYIDPPFNSNRNYEVFCDNSPALQGWVIRGKMPKVPAGTKERFCRPSGTFSIWARRFPALKRWAIFKATTR